MGCLRRAFALAAAAVVAAAPAAWAQEQEASEVTNFAFASRLGSGIYEVSGQVVQIYRIPISFGLLDPTPERTWALRMRIPVTLGFYDFELEDIRHEGIPTVDDVGTLGLSPGLYFEVPVNERWTLWPYAEGGPIRDLTAGTTFWTYTVGLRSDVVWQKRFQWVERNDFAWTGASGEERALNDAFGEIRTGGEVWAPTGKFLGGSSLDVGAFAANFLYWKPARFLNEALQEKPYRIQWEVGLLLRARPELSILKIPLPNVGASYRFGDSPSSVRLVFGRAF